MPNLTPTTPKEILQLSGININQTLQQQIDALSGGLADVVIGDFDPTVMQEVTGTLSQANIVAMNGAAVELIAAPASGKVILIDEIELFHDFTTTAYTGGGDVSIQYGAAVATITLIDVTFVTGNADTKRLIRPTIYNLDDTTGTGVGFSLTPVAAANVNITNATAVFAAGNVANIIKYRIRYHTVTLLT